MDRPIVGFERDEEGHWVAGLRCGHRQHLRHAPPFVERPWVQTEAGRAARIGSPLGCVRCERREMPDDFRAYHRTPEFDQDSVPDALRKRHVTKPGTWALIHVLAGELEYAVDAPFHTRERLVAGSRGVVLPEVEHALSFSGPARFFVEFWRAEA